MLNLAMKAQAKMQKKLSTKSKNAWCIPNKCNESKKWISTVQVNNNKDDFSNSEKICKIDINFPKFNIFESQISSISKEQN